MSAAHQIIEAYGRRYQYVRTVTIDKTKITNTDQNNFPVLFSGTYAFLATLANGGKVTHASGFDIIFTSDIAGLTKLDHEIESYSPTTGAVSFWVRVPTVATATDTVIYLWYGNSSITTSQENVPGVWDANFKAVWHLGNGVTLNAADSTGNHNGTVVGATAGAGQIVGAAVLSGSGQYIDTFASQISPVGSRTLSAWINPSGTAREGIMATRNAAGAAGFGFLLNRTTAGNLTYFHTAGSILELAAGVTPGSWFLVAFTLNTGTAIATLYANGVALGSLGSFSVESAPTFNGVLGAEDGLFSGLFTGSLDEVRISNSVRSGDWLATEYNNQFSPSTFYAVGNEY